ncbi:MAG TPA: hypothetical protein VNZ58_06450 [Thermomicrobiales bacterium]|nr:hypothetical protein [Thermomicrobiales bacterium]
MRRRSNPTITHSNSWQRSHLLTQIVLVLAIVMSSFSVAAAQETPTAEPVVAAQAESVPTEEPVPIDVPTPEPTIEPTPTPELVPTDTPAPDPDPTATPEPTVEPTVEPTIEPTPTDTPAPTPTVTPEASPTPAKKSLAVAPMAAQNTTGACNETSDGGNNVVGGGGYEYVRFYCKNIWFPGDFTVSVTAASSGWSYGIDRIDGVSMPRTGATSPTRFDATTPYNDFYIYFGRTSSKVTNCGQITVTLTSLGTKAVDTTTLKARPHGTGWGQCTYEGGAQPVTASLVGESLPSLPFSFDGRTVIGKLSIQVSNPSKTTGWWVDVRGDDFTYTSLSDVKTAGVWPASALTVDVDGVIRTLSTTDQRIVSSGGNGETYTYPLTLTVPPGAAVGTYTTTITLTTSSGPGGS